MTDETVFRVRLAAPTVDELKAFTDEIEPDLGCRAIARQADGEVAIDAYLTEGQLRAARQSRRAGRVSVEVVANETEAGRERQREVGSGDRFATRGGVPRGLGVKE
ncbi:hypothetical protein [Phytohabitans rumicis]|uniref:Uncharacterized protein n=1 Tax=Phytohabitans rumicis TaxID=1076125 RepID=A0A6V8L2Q3_9ACTN|nr:hypothetical protein [Phytohabitans rumicis]GFJ88386.1 hypothetical protein Prum_020280 [Phytohabitans rumicis]